MNCRFRAARQIGYSLRSDFLGPKMIFEQIATGGCQSYLLGCDDSHSAILIDPHLQQIDRYLGLAAKDGPVVIDVVVTRDPAKMLPAVDNRTVEAKKGDRVA